jgi:hypothetical protein
MKKITRFLVLMFLVMLIAFPVFSATSNSPNKNHSGYLGESGKAWYKAYVDYLYLTGGTAYKFLFTGTPSADRTYTLPDKSGTIAMTSDVSTAAPAINAVTGAAADTTIAFTAYQGTFTSTLTNKDMFTFQGLGNFGDVSVMRIEQKTGNATDGTVLEVVAADADVDPLVVSTSGQAGVLKVNGAGTVSIIGNTDITGTLSATTMYNPALAAAASGNTNLTVDASGNGTITIGGVSTGNTILPGAVVANGNVDIGNAATDTLTITSIIDSNVTLDDGSTDSPSLILKDATDETATLTKTDGSVTTFTTAAAGGLSIRTGNLWVGNGSPGTAAMDGEDLYVEGAAEFDAAVTLDGAVTANSTFATIGATTLGNNSTTVAVDSNTWDVSTAGAFTGVADITGTAGEAMTVTIASDGAADDLTLSVTGANDSSVILSSAGTGADAIGVHATAGGIDLDSASTSASAIDIDATGTVAGNAITVNTTNGGIAIVAAGADNGDLTLTAGDDMTVGATGTVAITSADWGISATGAVTGVASVAYDNSVVVYNTTVSCSNACIKALRASPLELVATPGAGKYIELISAQLILNYGTNVLTESTDNLVIEYGTSGQDATAAIETTGFIDQAADQMAFILPQTIATVAAANVVNNNIRLFNTGDGKFAGNAGNDTVMTIQVSYRVHTTGL